MFRMLNKTKTLTQLASAPRSISPKRTLVYEAGMSYLFFQSSSGCLHLAKKMIKEPEVKVGFWLSLIASGSFGALGLKYAIEALNDAKAKESLAEEYVRAAIKK